MPWEEVSEPNAPQTKARNEKFFFKVDVWTVLTYICMESLIKRSMSLQEIKKNHPHSGRVPKIRTRMPGVFGRLLLLRTFMKLDSSALTASCAAELDYFGCCFWSSNRFIYIVPIYNNYHLKALYKTCRSNFYAKILVIMDSNRVRFITPIGKMLRNHNWLL